MLLYTRKYQQAEMMIDARFGILTEAIYNTAPMRKNSRRPKATDFFPSLAVRQQATRERSPEELKRAFLAHFG